MFIRCGGQKILPYFSRIMTSIQKFIKRPNRIASYSKKIQLSIIIGCFCLIIYWYSFTKARDIQRIKISHEAKQQPSIKIGGFYHFSTIGSRWKGIVAEQVWLAHSSGLVAATSNIYVTGLGGSENNKTSYHFFQDSKFIYEYDTRTDLYEYATLKKLEKFCLHNNDSFVWYAHSKAASREGNDMGPWRDVMNFFVLDGWRHCHGLLARTNYSTCGAILTHDTLYKPDRNTFYAGNMWWAKCSHVNKLIPIEVVKPKDRYYAEEFITSIPGEPYFNCFYTHSDGLVPLNRERANCTVNQPLWIIH